MASTLVNNIISTEKQTINQFLSKQGKIYTFLNPVSYLTALDNKKLFEQFDGIFADGSILVAAIKVLYGKSITRRSFDMTSLAPQLLSYAEQNKKTIYIVASKQEQVEKAVDIFKERYPNLQISGYRNGYFTSDSEMDKEAKNITEINPDFLIVGMGALMQERFLIKAKLSGFQGIGFTCGGFIHQTSKNEIEYYPIWADKLNLRFVYRMYKEKHTRKRYIQAAFLFPIRFVYERIFG
jgi:exopolysaccharide biosynthesis WecB/TagA/CpsF family protein